MKQFLIYTILLATSVACKKTISVDLQDTASRTVIEGTVTNATTAEVTVSKSVPFSHSNSFPQVSAVVSITDNGVRYELTEIKPGTYRNSSLVGISGHTYHLSVKAEGKEYTATSTMPLEVKFDSLHLEKIFWGSELIWVVNPNIKTPRNLVTTICLLKPLMENSIPIFGYGMTTSSITV